MFTRRQLSVARFVLIALSAASLGAQTKAPALKSFFIAAHMFPDLGGDVRGEMVPWSEYILDVQPNGSGATVRHMLLAPVNPFCPNVVTIRAQEKRIALSPEHLFRPVNPCRVEAPAFDRIRKRAVIKGAISNVGYTIVATCGDEQRIFQVPYTEPVDLKRLKRESPNAAKIVELYRSLVGQVFPNESIDGERHALDYELQVSGQMFVPTIQSGRFDAAFDPGRLSDILKLHHGPISRAESLPTPVLVDAQKWAFVSRTVLVYPPLARQARIEGKVELELSVEPSTGQVAAGKVVHGHPLLAQWAIEAATKWTFDPAQTLPATINVTLDYSLACKITRGQD